MSDIQTTYSLTLKDGLYYKMDGSAFPKTNSCNLVRSKLQSDGFKVTVVPVKPDGYALRVLALGESSRANKPISDTNVSEQQSESGKQKSIEELRKEVEELEERKRLEDKLAELKGAQALARGNAPANKPKRKSMGRRDILNFDVGPDYVGRIVNDEGRGIRIRQFIEEGWEVDPTYNLKTESDGDANRPSQFGSAIARPVGTDTGGKPVMGVLMRKRKDLYEEGEREKQAVEDAKMAQLTRTPEGFHPTKGSQYAVHSAGVEAEADKVV